MKKITIEFPEEWIQLIDEYKEKSIDSRVGFMRKLVFLGLVSFISDFDQVDELNVRKYLKEKLLL